MQYVVKLVIGIELIELPESTLCDIDGELIRHVEESIEALEHRWTNECGFELDLGRSEATYFVSVDTGDETRAISQARGLLSIAVHAAGGATPHRPFPRERGLVGEARRGVGGAGSKARATRLAWIADGC